MPQAQLAFFVSTHFTHFPSEQIFNSVITPDGKLVMARGHISGRRHPDPQLPLGLCC